jgi:uncharacterized membrane protein YphA (DoxX/SURF4 family)
MNALALGALAAELACFVLVLVLSVARALPHRVWAWEVNERMNQSIG